MIIAECGGGLGNQLNIYAATKTIAMKKKVTFKLDISFYSNWPKRRDAPREYNLDKFLIDPPIASKNEIRKFIFKTNNRIVNKLFRKFRLFEKKSL